MGLLQWLFKSLFGRADTLAAPEPIPTMPEPVRTELPSSSVRRPTALGLDASQLLPIAREEQIEAAKQSQSWASPWFGRRDLIPPANDPRTNLIDRGLVTHGLLSPEQLVEIHEVGAEMERLRPSLESANRQAVSAGEAAVQADRERRAAVKAQKKKEAAERRAKRAEAIAKRRATDIQFLGRGVSGRLGERQSNPDKLAELGLPLLSTPSDLATALNLSIPRLRWLAFHTDVATRIHYVTFTVPKKSGGLRTLSVPHRTLAAAQRWILDNILDLLPCEPAAHGFLRGRSTLTNAHPHTGKAIVLKMDLENFFPSITFPRVRSAFHRIGYSPAVATILALLCTECPRRLVEYDGKPYWVATGPRGLPQGACTSPAISNQVSRRLDKRLSGLAAKLGLTYTRYADDMTFSGQATLEPLLGHVMARVRHLAQDEGFALNRKKTRVLRRHTAQRVTGLIVNDRPGVPRREIRQLRAILHRAKTEGLDHQNRAGQPNFRAWLEGKIAYVSMVQPEIGKKLRDQFARITSGINAP